MSDKAVIEIDIEKAKRDLQSLTETIKQLNAAGDDNEETVKALEKQWGVLDSQIKQAEKSTDSMVNSMAALPGPVGNAAKGFQGLVKAAKAFIATPIGAVITAIVGALTLMVNALKSSEEGQMKLAKVTGYLKGLLQGLTNIIVKSGEALAALFTGDWVGFKKSISGTVDEFKNMHKTATAMSQISQDRLKYEKAIAENAKKEAEIKGRIIKLQAIYNDNTKSAKERQDALVQSEELEEEMMDNRIKLQKQNIELLKKEQALGNNTLEDNNQLIQEETNLQNIVNEKEQLHNSHIRRRNEINKKGLEVTQKTTEELKKQVDIIKQVQSALEQYNQNLIDKQHQANEYWANAVTGQIVGKSGSKNITILDQFYDKQNKILRDLTQQYSDFNDEIRDLNLGTESLPVNDIESFLTHYEKMLEGIRAGVIDVSQYPDAISDRMELFKKVTSYISSYTSNIATNIRISTIAAQNSMDNMINAYTGRSDEFTHIDKFFESEEQNLRTMQATLKQLIGGEEVEGAITDIVNAFKPLGERGIRLLESYIKDRMNMMNRFVEDYNNKNIQAAQELVDFYQTTNASLDSIHSAKMNLLELEKRKEEDNIGYIAAEKLKAGYSQIEIDKWVADEQSKIDETYAAKRKSLWFETYNSYASIASSAVASVSSILNDSFEDNKGIQIATTVATTTANAAQTFGSVFAQAPGGVVAKAAQAALASGAVIASGVKAIKDIKKTTKNSSSISNSSSSSSVSGSSRDTVSSQLIYNRVSPGAGEEKYTSVLVVDEVTAKQKQIANSDRVRVM